MQKTYTRSWLKNKDQGAVRGRWDFVGCEARTRRQFVRWQTKHAQISRLLSLSALVSVKRLPARRGTRLATMPSTRRHFVHGCLHAFRTTLACNALRQKSPSW